jgi:hypothetical protein
VLALLTAMPANRLAAAALAELFNRRRSKLGQATGRRSPAPLEGDETARIVHRAGLLDRGTLDRQRQRNGRVDRARPVKFP